MKVKISQPLAIHESGARSLNEDFIFPIHSQANPEERLFVVCDGEGGPNAGEVAAKLVALSFAKYFASSPPKGNVTQIYLDGALQTAEEALSAYKESHPESLGMATTLALLHIGDEQITVGWVGNTHIYQFSKIGGQLSSPSQEKGDSKALITGKDNPQSLFVRTFPIQDLRTGDLFFLATDGISDQIDNEGLSEILAGGEQNSTEAIIADISSKLEGSAQDNYSGYLIQVGKLTVETPVDQEPAAAAAVGGDSAPEPTAGSGNFIRNAFMGLIVVVILGLIGVLIWTSNTDPYTKAMAGGTEAFEAGDFTTAMDSFSRAYNLASNQEDAARALEENQHARNALATIKGGNPSRGIDFYLDAAGEFLRNGNNLDAIRSWENARLRAEEDSIPDPRLMAMRQAIAQAYLKEGRAAYDLIDESEGAADMAKEYFQKGLALNEELADSVKVDAELLADASDRLDILQTGNAEEQTLASGQTQSRGLGPAQEQETSASNARKAAPQTQSRSVNPSETSSTRSNARVAPTRSALDGPTLSAAEKTELNKNLATGKRLFTQAKDAESDFLYKTSAEKLEASGPMIDGAGAYLLSYLYHMGKGVAADEQKALRYAQLSARKNWPAGQYYYAYLLLERQNPRDTLTALQSLQAAANQNYLDAERLLQTLR